MENVTMPTKEEMKLQNLKNHIHDVKYEIKLLNQSLAAPTMPERPTMDDIRKLMNGEYTMEEKRVCDRENLKKMTALLAKLEAELAGLEAGE